MNQHDIDQFPNIYFRNMKEIEENLLEFLETQDKIKENFNIFNKKLEEKKIFENKYETKSFLYLIVSVSNHYHRTQYFFPKIELILKSIQETIQNYFSNYEIFHIFQKSKRLLLFLFEFGILTPTLEIYSNIKNNNKYLTNQYIEYFYPEFDQFIESNSKEKYSIKEDSIDEFNNKREKGENDHYICDLIRNDSVVEFISYINKEKISPSSTIQQSIYETNLFLMNKNPSLIEYSIFFGSIQIFKYLYQQNVQLTESFWPYAIHSKNGEIIHFIEDQKINTLSGSFQYLIIESIKCHHQEITDYLRDKISKNEKIYNYFIYRKSLKFYNFAIFTDNVISSLFKFNIPYYLSKYDYYLIIEYLLKTNEDFDINRTYQIFKPVPQTPPNVIFSIAIKNGDLEQKSEDEDDYYSRMKSENMDYVTYLYDDETSTILNTSTRKGNFDIIQLLIGQQTLQSDRSSTKNYKEIKSSFSIRHRYYMVSERITLAQEAVESGSFEVVQYLMKKKLLNVKAESYKSKTYRDYFSTARERYEENCNKPLLHFAIEKGNIEIIKLLISNPDIDINLKSVSRIKQSGGCISYSSSSSRIEKSSLFVAIESGNIEIVKLLLSNNDIDVNSGIIEITSKYCDETILEKTPLYMAVENDNLGLVKLFLDHPKIKINFQRSSQIKQNNKKVIQKNTALDLAKSKNNNEMIQLLSKMESLIEPDEIDDDYF